MAQAVKVAFNLTDDDDFNRWVIVQRASLVIRDERIEAEWENTGKELFGRISKNRALSMLKTLLEARLKSFYD